MESLFLFGNSDIKIALGKRIKKYRIDIGYSQDDLSRKSGVSRHTISNIENGYGMTLDNLINILRAMNLLQNINELVPEVAANPFDIEAGITNRQRIRNK